MEIIIQGFIEIYFVIENDWKQRTCPSIENLLNKLFHIYLLKYFMVIKNNLVNLFVSLWNNPYRKKRQSPKLY